MFNTYATSMFKWKSIVISIYNPLASNPRDTDALVVFHAGCGSGGSAFGVAGAGAGSRLPYLDIYKWTTEVVVSIESLTGRRKVDFIPPG